MPIAVAKLLNHNFAELNLFVRYRYNRRKLEYFPLIIDPLIIVDVDELNKQKKSHIEN